MSQIRAAASTAVTSTSVTPPFERTLSRSTSVTGAPASRAATAPARIPTSQPARTPTTATPALSIPLSSQSCHRRAPNQTSLRRASSRSRRIPRAASTVNASRRAAPSPPTSRRRRPATFAECWAARSSSTGASIANEDERSVSSMRARSLRRTRSSMSQSRGSPAASGHTHAYVRYVRASAAVRSSAVRPSARTSGAGGGR